MTLQYIILAIILTLCASYLVHYFYVEWRQNVKCKDYGCAGCPFYKKCTKTIKK